MTSPGCAVPTGLRYAFAGTPEFAVPVLAALIESFGDARLVLSQPDRPAGRGRRLTACPVKRLALEHGLETFQPQRLDEAAIERLVAAEIDVLIVVAYGLLLPQRVLDIPRHGCLNLHASLLPRWRGAAPIQRAIEAGDAETGVCLMHMEAGLDTGPVYACRTTPIADDDTAATLHDRLARLGAGLLVETLPGVLSAAVRPIPQSSEGVTRARKLNKAEARIDWTMGSVEIDRRVRAFNPWPVAQTAVPGLDAAESVVLRIHAARRWRGDAPDHGPRNPEPGTLLWAGRDQPPLVHCGDGFLELERLQWPGGRVMAAADALRGRMPESGGLALG